MLIIIAATVIALALTYIVMMKSHKSDPAQLAEPRGTLLTVGIQIICGNCSGEEDRPHKTYLDRYGCCAQCGSHNYILASNRGVYARELVAARLSEREGEAHTGRVLPFEVPYGPRTAQANKIAV